MNNLDNNELLQYLVRRPQFVHFMASHRIPAESYDVDIAALPRFVRLRIGRGACKAADEHACVQRLAREIDATPVCIPWLPSTLAVYSLPSSGRLAGTSTDYKTGAVCGMDCASVVAVIALAVEPGQDVLDLCCAPGTKLALIADIMCGRGTLTGVDVSSARLSTARSQLMRLCLFSCNNDSDGESITLSSPSLGSPSSLSSSPPSSISSAAAAVAPTAAKEMLAVELAEHTERPGHSQRLIPQAHARAETATSAKIMTSTVDLGETTITTGADTSAPAHASSQRPQKRARVVEARHTHSKSEQVRRLSPIRRQEHSRDNPNPSSRSRWTCRLYHGDSRAFRQGPSDGACASWAASTPHVLPASDMNAPRGGRTATNTATAASEVGVAGILETKRAAHPVLVAHSAVQMQKHNQKRAQKRLNKSARARLRRLIARGQGEQCAADCHNGSVSCNFTTNVAHETSAQHFYDRVLVDAECTHDGSLRHLLKLARRVMDPNDVAHTWDTFDDVVLCEQRAATVQIVQQELLQTGFALLRTGGFIVYATCSLSRRQNEDVIASLLEAEPSAQPVSILAPDGCLEGGLSAPPCELVDIGTKSTGPIHALRFTPRQGTSGLFVAKITKVMQS